MNNKMSTALLALYSLTSGLIYYIKFVLTSVLFNKLLILSLYLPSINIIWILAIMIIDIISLPLIFSHFLLQCLWIYNLDISGLINITFFPGSFLVFPSLEIKNYACCLLFIFLKIFLSTSWVCWSLSSM